MRNLFRIRSAVEHLHGPLTAIAASDERARGLLLLLRAMQAEALARYCLARLLMIPDLHFWFRTDADLARFWSLSSTDREHAWGPKLDFAAVSNGFDDSYIDDEDLGLT